MCALVILFDTSTDAMSLLALLKTHRDIVIGRVKLDTVNGANHGFLLKR